MPQHARTQSSSEPSFCKRSSSDYDPARCRRFKQRKRSGRSDTAVEELVSLIVDNLRATCDQQATVVQGIVFDKDRFNAEQARSWLRRNGFVSGKSDETENELRFRQKEPGQFKTFRKKKLTAGVTAIVAR